MSVHVLCTEVVYLVLYIHLFYAPGYSFLFFRTFSLIIVHKTVFHGCSAPCAGMGHLQHRKHLLSTALIGQGIAVPLFDHKPYGTPDPNYSDVISPFVLVLQLTGLTVPGSDGHMGRRSVRYKAVNSPWLMNCQGEPWALWPGHGVVRSQYSGAMANVRCRSKVHSVADLPCYTFTRRRTPRVYRFMAK